MLRRGVGRLVLLGTVRAGGREIDDRPAFARCPHGEDLVLHAEVGAPDVDPLDRVEEVVVEFRDGNGFALDRGSVDRCIEAAESVDGKVDHLGHGVGIGNVGIHHDARSAEDIDQRARLVQAGNVDVAENDGRPLLRKRHGDPAAHAGCRPRDHYGRSFELLQRCTHVR